MKTKEQAIQEAWGKYWKEVEDNVLGMGTDAGWADNDSIHYNENLGCDSMSFEFSGSLYRPKSLKGIGTNNGWIKIESETDLPKGNGLYWTLRQNSSVALYKEVFNDLDAYFWLNTYTHYQPIFKPGPPIY